MTYNVYTIKDSAISGKVACSIKEVMKLISEYVSLLDDNKVDEVIVSSFTDTNRSHVIFHFIKQQHFSFNYDTIFYKKVYSPLEGYFEDISILQHCPSSITNNLLDNKLNNDITLDNIKVYSLKTGEFIKGRKKTYLVKDGGYADLVEDE